MKVLKQISSALLIAALCLFASNDVLAQKSNEKIMKQLKKELKDKPAKEVRKECKKLKKQGYYVAPGIMMEKMLETSYLRRMEMDDQGYPRWMTGEASSVAQTKISAKNQAMEAAKLELAGKIETNVVALIEQSLANNQIDQEEAASLTKTVTGAKNIISQKLGRVVVFFEAYKDIGRNVESTVTIGYDSRTAYAAVKQTIKEELEDEADAIHEKLDKMLDF